MNDCTTVVGLDVHKKTIVTAVLPAKAERVMERSTLENCPKVIEKLVTRIGARGPAVFVYEAGPCGYEVQRQIAALGHRCVVIAPSMTPRRPGDRVKTDRRDAEKLARLYRAGELAIIYVPTREEEAARDLVRAREDAVGNRLRAQHRLSKFLLRQGRVHRETKSWGVAYRAWLRTQRFEWTPLQQTYEASIRALEDTQAQVQTLDQQLKELAHQEPYRTPVQYLRCLKGIDTLSALTLTVEVHAFQRFEQARAFMSYAGLGVSEASSGEKIRRGGITKVGNAHLRRILIESAWCYARRPSVMSYVLAKRREGCPPEVIRVAKRAQQRLYGKFWQLVSRNKLPQVAVVAVARELAGFVWAIARQVPEANAV